MANQFLIKNTMADIQALSATEISALKDGTYCGVELLGYYKKGDTPLPIIYFYEIGDPRPEDGGSVIAVGNDRLIHEFTIVNPVYFGVKYDGITDNSLMLQRAFNLGNPVEYFVKGNGSCRFTIPIQIKNSFTSNALFKSESLGGCFVISEKSTNNILKVNGGLIVEGTFSNSSLTENQHGFNVQNVSGVEIKEIEIRNTKGDSIYVSQSASNIEVRDCVFDNPYRNGVSFINCNNVRIINNIIKKPFNYVVGIDLEANYSTESITDILIEGNTIITPAVALNIASVGTIDGVSVVNNNFRAKYGIVSQPNETGIIKNVTIDNNTINADFPIWGIDTLDLKSYQNNNFFGAATQIFTEVSGLNKINSSLKSIDNREYNVLSLPKTRLEKSGVYKVLKYQGGVNGGGIRVTSSLNFSKLSFNSGFYTTGEDSMIGDNSYKINLPPVLTSYKLAATNAPVQVNPNDVIYFQLEVKITDASINQIVIRKLPNAIITTIVTKDLKENEWVTIKGFYAETNANNGGLSLYFYKNDTVDSKAVYVKNMIMLNCTASNIDMSKINPIEVENAVNLNLLTGGSKVYSFPSLNQFDNILFENGKYIQKVGTKVIPITSKTWTSDGINTNGYYEFLASSDADVIGTSTEFGSVATNITIAEGYKGGGYSRLNLLRIQILKTVIDSQVGVSLTDKFNSFITSLGRAINVYAQLKVTTDKPIDPLPDIVLNSFSNVEYKDVQVLEVVNSTSLNDKIFDASTTVKGLLCQSTASLDTATAPSAIYTQTEIQAILTELRNLKTNLRTAGILAT